MSRRGIGLLAASVVSLLSSGSSARSLTDVDPYPPSTEQQIERRVEQRVVSPTEKILEQIKSSVCGTGPIYVGPIDAPILVRPRLNMRCTLTEERRPEVPTSE